MPILIKATFVYNRGNFKPAPGNANKMLPFSPPGSVNRSNNLNPKHKILFAGDPHGDFKSLIAAVHEYKPEAVVLLGDYDLEMPLEVCLQEIVGLTQIWWIAGNHDFETPSKHKHLFHSALAENGLHLKVTEIAGLRIAGLGGIFLGRVWYPPQPPKWRGKQHYLDNQPANIRHTAMSLKYKGAIWHDEFEALKTLKADPKPVRSIYPGVWLFR